MTTTRQKEAEAKRRAIMNSPEFREWWTKRRLLSPIPTDPYRAFMIDRSLRAYQDTEEKWAKEPNELDLEHIDYPRHDTRRPPREGEERRQRRKRDRSKERRTPIDLPEPKGSPKHEAVKKAVTQDLEGMFEEFRVAKPSLRFKEGATVGEASTGVYSPAPFGGTPRITIATGPGVTSQIITGRHEAGHHIHLTSKGSLRLEGERRSLSPAAQVIPWYKVRAKETLEVESGAWAIGREFTKKRIKAGKEDPRFLGRFNWEGRYALSTYERFLEFKGKKKANPKFKEMKEEYRRMKIEGLLGF